MALPDTLDSGEEVDDPTTVQVPDLDRIVAAQAAARASDPGLDDIAPEGTLARSAPLPWVTRSTRAWRQELVTHAKLAAAVAVLLGLLVLVAVVGLVGGLGVSLAIASVAG